ncbi:MAG: hypothetical protein ACR2NR_04130 [Solirubrobacteraceae bacterium]
MPADGGRRKFSLVPPNPLRSEAGAFGFLVWFVCVVALILVIVAVIEAL